MITKILIYGTKKAFQKCEYTKLHIATYKRLLCAQRIITYKIPRKLQIVGVGKNLIQVMLTNIRICAMKSFFYLTILIILFKRIL